MGNEGSKMTLLRLAYYRDSEWHFSVFEASLVWGNTEDRAAGNEREKEIGFEREGSGSGGVCARFFRI